MIECDVWDIKDYHDTVRMIQKICTSQHYLLQTSLAVKQALSERLYEGKINIGKLLQEHDNFVELSQETKNFFNNIQEFEEIRLVDFSFTQHDIDENKKNLNIAISKALVQSTDLERDMEQLASLVIEDAVSLKQDLDELSLIWTDKNGREFIERMNEITENVIKDYDETQKEALQVEKTKQQEDEDVLL